MKCEICLIAVLFNAVFVSGAIVHLLFPKGFSITVNKIGDTKKADFDVNITRDNGNTNVASYYKAVHNAFANRWTFAKRNIMLHVGDVISYKVSTTVNNTANKIDSGECLVKDLPKIGKLQRHGFFFNYDIYLTDNDCAVNDHVIPSPVVVTTEDPTSSAEIDNEEMEKKLNECESTMFNASLSLLSLQMEVEELRNKTHELTDFEETYPYAKELTLSGRIPPDGDAVETVQFMLYEKLDLKPTIVSAFRNSPYRITFMVSSVVDKFKILEVAKYILPSTKIQIN